MLLNVCRSLYEYIHSRMEKHYKAFVTWGWFNIFALGIKKAKELYYPGFVPLESRSKIRKWVSLLPRCTELVHKAAISQY